MRTQLKATAAVIAAGALCLTVAACGSDGSGDGGDRASDLTASQQAAVEAAKASYEKFSATQALDAVPPLPSAPPTGKTMTIITCSLPVCITLSDGAADAAAKIGWKLTTLNSNSTPEGFVSAMNQVAANPPDALTYIGTLPDSSIKSQLAKIKAAGTKIVTISPIGDPLKEGSTVQAVSGGPADVAQSGKLMGDTVVADANGPAKSVFVWDPTYAGVWGKIKTSYQEVLGSAGSKPGILEVSNANIGKTVPSQIVSYLQAHPDTEYVALAIVDYNTGLEAALKAAGLAGKVKIVSRAANPSALKAIADGSQFASVGLELAGMAYRSVDQLARLMMNVPLGDRLDKPGWQQIYVKSNVTQTSEQPEPPDYVKAYTTAWHVG
ncbi:MAG: substrate-binding domain-containing protein [Nocardioidaceae bacterium]|nr:substrate-binding domain-containing protein [Nocardioidaceae bacterium]